jgi:D-sedoheptulose 7-phosphate isomerase
VDGMTTAAVRAAFAEHREAIDATEAMADRIVAAAEIVASALASGGQVLFCGNGGSAADAQHLAAEFVGRYLKDRRPWPALALSTNTSAVTAIGNDYGFGDIFARQVAAHGRPGDVLVAISTSGASENCLRAVGAARTAGMRVVVMTGRGGGELASDCDVHLDVPHPATPRIQECHVLMGHIICGLVEEALCATP